MIYHSLPQDCKLNTFCPPGATRQDVFNVLVCIPLQMLPIVHGLKATSLVDVVGFMMNWPLALQVDVVYGQQELEFVQVEVHWSSKAVSLVRVF